MGLNRRDFLRVLAATGGAGALGAFLQACGQTPSIPSPSPSVETATATPTITPVAAVPTATSEPTPTPAMSPSPSPTASPTVAEEAGMSKVALIIAEERADGVQRAIAALGINPVQGKRVVLKPNFNTADESPGSTHNDTLRSLILRLKDTNI